MHTVAYVGLERVLTDGVRQSETLQRPDFPQVCIVSTYKHIYCTYLDRTETYISHTNYLCIHTLIYAIMDIRMSVILFVESSCRSYHPGNELHGESSMLEPLWQAGKREWLKSLSG